MMTELLEREVIPSQQKSRRLQRKSILYGRLSEVASEFDNLKIDKEHHS